jgi:hypothetical protein
MEKSFLLLQNIAGMKIFFMSEKGENLRSVLAWR